MAMNGEPGDALGRLKVRFQGLPGIGPRTAERLAFHILRESREFAAELAQAILDVKDKIIHCRTCYNLTETDPGSICADANRDHGEIGVVEQPKDLMTLDATGLIRSSYHVLMGHIAPLEGVEPEDLTINALIDRVRRGGVREVVLALNPTLDGDGTSLHIQSLLSEFDVRVPPGATTVGSGVCAQEYVIAGAHLETTGTTYAQGGTSIFEGVGNVNFHAVVFAGDGTGTEGFDSNSVAVSRGRLLQLGTHFQCGDVITVTIIATNNQFKYDAQGLPAVDESGNPEINYGVGAGTISVTSGG